MPWKLQILLEHLEHDEDRARQSFGGNMSEDHMDRDGTDVKIVLREEAPDQPFGRPSNKFTSTIEEARRLMKDLEAAISAQNRVAAHGRGSAR